MGLVEVNESSLSELNNATIFKPTLASTGALVLLRRYGLLPLEFRVETPRCNIGACYVGLRIRVGWTRRLDTCCILQSTSRELLSARDEFHFEILKV